MIFETMDIIVMAAVLPIAFILAYAGYCIQLVTQGVIWGIRVAPSPSQKRFKTVQWILFVLSMIASFILVVPAIKAVLSLMMRSFIIALIYCAVVAAVFIGALFIARHNSNKMLYSGKETNTFVLSELPFVKAVEGRLQEATYFIVSFEGIALVNSMNYCFELARYENYQMGSLTSPREVALIGMYFVQKYHDQFDYKVDMEVIPGEPGQTIVSFGTGGIGVARIKGTRDKRIFRSYIFTKKQGR